jgi:thiosulfate reductase cytochrome b subunit
MSQARDQSVGPKKRHLHPLPIRVMHWTNAVAMLIMISSGWKIYNDDVIFGWLHFPDALTLGHWAQHGLQWHFFGMWILVLNGIAYLIYGLVTGRFRRTLFPISLRALLKDISDALHFRLAHDDPTRYNAVQRLLYVGILLVGVLIVMSGLVLWKPVQFSELAALFYNFQTARLVHFLCMTAIVLFLTVHVTLALIVPQTLVAMVTGGPVVDEARRTTPAPNPSGSKVGRHDNHPGPITVGVSAQAADRPGDPWRGQGPDRENRSPQRAARRAQPRRAVVADRL